MTLPNLSNERLEQMIYCACACKQDCVKLRLRDRLAQHFHQKSSKLFYGVGATAVSFSCLGALWIVPLMTAQTELTVSEITISEYIMQDLLADLS
jgi:hypothetical protein